MDKPALAAVRDDITYLRERRDPVSSGDILNVLGFLVDALLRVEPVPPATLERWKEEDERPVLDWMRVPRIWDQHTHGARRFIDAEAFIQWRREQGIEPWEEGHHG